MMVIVKCVYLLFLIYRLRSIFLTPSPSLSTNGCVCLCLLFLLSVWLSCCQSFGRRKRKTSTKFFFRTLPITNNRQQQSEFMPLLRKINSKRFEWRLVFSPIKYSQTHTRSHLTCSSPAVSKIIFHTPATTIMIAHTNTNKGPVHQWFCKCYRNERSNKRTTSYRFNDDEWQRYILQ